MNRLEILQARIERLMKLTQSGKLSQKDIERAHDMITEIALQTAGLRMVAEWDKNAEKHLQDLRKSALPSGVSYPRELF